MCCLFPCGACADEAGLDPDEGYGERVLNIFDVFAEIAFISVRRHFLNSSEQILIIKRMAVSVSPLRAVLVFKYFLIIQQTMCTIHF